MLTTYGFTMGQFAMMDHVGLDTVGQDSSVRPIMGDLVAAGRLGQKSCGGHFDYDDQRKAVTSPAAAEILAQFANDTKAASECLSDQEILECLLYSVVDESALLLEEGVALRASGIAVALVAGYG